MKAMRRKRTSYPIREDAWGFGWYVRDADYGCGIEWLRGWPIDLIGRSPAQIIITASVKEFLEQHKRGVFTLIDQLPFSVTSLKKLRQQLGIDRSGAAVEWWESRSGDLAALSNIEFAKIHSVDADSVGTWRKRLDLPPLRHADAWYMRPEALADLSSETMPLAFVAAKYGRSITTIWQIRYLLRKEQGLPITDRRGFPCNARLLSGSDAVQLEK